MARKFLTVLAAVALIGGASPAVAQTNTRLVAVGETQEGQRTRSER